MTREELLRLKGLNGRSGYGSEVTFHDYELAPVFALALAALDAEKALLRGQACFCGEGPDGEVDGHWSGCRVGEALAAIRAAKGEK